MIKRNKKGQFIKGNITCGNKGKKLPPFTDAHKRKLAESKIGDKNPAKRLDVRKKLSKAQRGKKRTEGWKAKMRVRFTGDKNPNWKGGIKKFSNQIRDLPEYTRWRLKVFIRDNFTCVNCNNVGGNLEAHHTKELNKILKEYNIKTIKEALDCKELWEVDNGATLCKKCHRLTF